MLGCMIGLTWMMKDLVKLNGLDHDRMSLQGIHVLALKHSNWHHTPMKVIHLRCDWSYCASNEVIASNIIIAQEKDTTDNDAHADMKGKTRQKAEARKEGQCKQVGHQCTCPRIQGYWHSPRTTWWQTSQVMHNMFLPVWAPCQEMDISDNNNEMSVIEKKDSSKHTNRGQKHQHETIKVWTTYACIHTT